MKGDTVFHGKVVVVGAGVAGLVTAHLLAEAGCDVVVVEKLDALGGLARSFTYDEGFVFDVGPHRFHTANPNVKAYLDRTLKGEGAAFPRRSEVFFRDLYYRWPLQPKNLTQLPYELAARAFVDLAANSFRKIEVDNFESYVINQYGRALYENFFKDYSIKFLGIHPQDTHADWAKTGINRAIIDEKLQMHNITQLAKTTLMQARKTDIDFLYPKGGMHRAWVHVARALESHGGRILTGVGARLEADGDRIAAVHAGDERIPCSTVIWTAPITLALKQLGQPVPRLDYLGLVLYNVLVRGEAKRPYQWCYFGEKSIIFNRISIPKCFAEDTAPPGTHGLCVEVTCREGDARWQHAEGLTDWVIDDLVRVDAIPDRASVENVYIERIPDSYPIYHKAYPEDLDKARRSLAPFKNLHLAGRTGMFWYNNMDHSMENAMQLAKRLLREAGRADAEESALAQGMLAG